MERKLTRVPVMILTLLLAAAAFFLRRSQLKTAFDEIGVVAGSSKLLIWIALAVIVLFAVYSYFLRGRKKYASISSRYLPLMAVSCLAAVMLLISSILTLTAMEHKSDILIALGGVLTAACWAATAASRYQGKAANPAFFLIPTVFYVVDLVLQFRLWTRDPVILDYCYDLGAMICMMCALLHLGNYCFDKGARRLTTFFSLCGVFFGAAALAGASFREAAGYAAGILWLLVNLWLLLRPASARSKTEET